MLRRIFATAVIAGVIAGASVWGAQLVKVVPLILKGEVYEQAMSSEGPAPAGGHRVTLVQMVTGRKWVVAELEKVKPLYQNNFDRQRDAPTQRSFQIDAMRFQIDWFDSDNIRARTHYVPPQSDDSSDSTG